MRRSRLGLVLLAVLAITVAGCGSIGSQPGATPTATTAESPASQTPTTSAEAVKQRAIDAVDDVQRYRVEAEESRTVVGNLPQRIELEQAIEVDRANRSLHVALTQTSQGQAIESDSYLLDDTLYQRHPGFVQQFATEWLSMDLSGNETQAWQARDALARQQSILAIADPRLNRTETVDGTETYRLEASPDLEELEGVFAELVTGSTDSLNESTYEISDGTFTYWIAQETGRPVRVAGQMNSTISSPRQTVELRQSFAFDYDYDTRVSIELPEAAEDAIPLQEALNSTDSSS